MDIVSQKRKDLLIDLHTLMKSRGIDGYVGRIAYSIKHLFPAIVFFLILKCIGGKYLRSFLQAV